MNTVKLVWSAFGNLAKAANRLAERFDNLSEEIERRNEAEKVVENPSNGVQTGHRTKAKV